MHILITKRTPAAPWRCRNACVVHAGLASLGVAPGHGRLGWTLSANANRKYSATWHKQRHAECGPGALPASAPSRGVRKGRRPSCVYTERSLDRTRAQPSSTRARPRRGAGRGGLGCAPFADTANAPRTVSRGAPGLAERTRRSAYFGAPGGHARAQLPRRLRGPRGCWRCGE